MWKDRESDHFLETLENLEILEILPPPSEEELKGNDPFQRFRKGVGRRGLATNEPPKRGKKKTECVPLPSSKGA